MKKILTLCLAVVLLMSCFVTTVNVAAATVDKTEETISAAAGEFKITFGEDVTDEMLNTISFKKKSDDGLVDIKGGAYIEADSEDPKVAVVKYGVLENKSDYVLTVGEESYDYTVSEMEFIEDFESYEVGEKLPERPGAKTDKVPKPVIYFPSTANVPSGTATGTVDSHYIDETTDGDKYVALDPSKAEYAKNGRIVLEFPDPIKDDEFCVDIKVRINGKFNSKNLLFAHLGKDGASGKRISAAAVTSGAVDVPASNLAGGTVSGSKSLSKVGDDGFYDLRMYLKRNADGSYTSNLQNLNAPEEGMITVKSTATGCDGVYCIWLTQFSVVDKGVTGGVSLDLSCVKVHKKYSADILHIDEVEKTDREMSVVFTNDVDEETLSSMEMKDKDGAKVDLTFDRYYEASRRAYYKIGQVLRADTEYTLSLAGVKDEEGLDLASESSTFKTMPEKYTLAEPSLTDGNGNTVTAIGNAAKLTYSNTLAAEAGKKFTLALAIFDSDNRLVAVASDTDSVVAGQASVTLSATTPAEIVLSDGHIIRPYIWEEDAVDGNVFVAVLDEIE